MKRRLLPLLLSACLVLSLLPAAFAQEETEETPQVTALCVARPGQSVFLDEGEFQLLCQQVTGSELQSVTFSPLPARVGKLTCKETWDADDPDILPNTYYSYRSPRLSQVCFTPYLYLSSQFTGQEELPFTMVNRRDETVSGVLVLCVPEEPEDSVKYSLLDRTVNVSGGVPIPLTEYLPSQIQHRVASPPTGGPWTVMNGGVYVDSVLTSASFTYLPSSDLGSLWLNYGGSKARKVLPGESLFLDKAPYYYDVTFVPATRDSAEILLTFTASCDGAADVSGRLTLNLKSAKPADKPAAHPSSRLTAVPPSPAAVSAYTDRVGLSDSLYSACASRGQGSLKTVVFDTLPTAQEGTVLSADVPVTVGAAYPYDALSFLPGQAFQGGITLRYVGLDSMDLSFSGLLTFDLDYPAGGRFQDLEGWEWAAHAVRFLDMRRAVPYSGNDPSFRPGDPATRMELTYALVEVAYPAAEKAAPPDFSDLPDDAGLAYAASVAVAHGLLRGDGEGRLLPDAQVTRQDALVMIHRALVDLGRDLPAPEDLSAFSDAGSLSPYAREAAAVLCAMDILRGDGSGKLNPLSPITRAEMACLLCRAFDGQG